MTQPKNIYQRLNQVMAEVESVQKEKKAGGLQYSFTSHDAVSKALHMPMVRAGIAMIPDIKDFKQETGVDQKNNPVLRTTMTMLVTFINVDNPEDKVSVTYFGQGIDNQDKGIGKAISYAVKYALLKVFCLETGDDVEKDNIEYKADPKKAEEVALLSDEQIHSIAKILGNNSERLTKLLNHFNVKLLREIPAEHYEGIIKGLTAPAKVQSIKEKAS
jgi:hypothetical protein